ncbi:MAG: hypothetical protein ACYC7D_04115 [Nitrososphaerales archaeon]
MKLIFIYGPPASGKFTIARELAKLTDYKLFHNHVSIGFVQSLFEFGTPTFWKFVNKYRLEMLEEAAKENINVITTFVYAKGSDDRFVKAQVAKVKKYRGKVCFVRLSCDRDTLFSRVTRGSRKELGKIATKKLLKEMLTAYDVESEILSRNSLTIDTTHESPKSAARLIARHFNLIQ